MYHHSHSQQVQGPLTLACFQLAKFSYTTTSINHRGPLTWSHVFGNGDIIGAFERSTTLPSEGILFRVRNNHETLEEVGITDLMREFDNQVQYKQDGSRPRFAVVVKLPCLAVKYPQRPGYVRRFQIKFSSDRDFYSALAILSEINCPFSESNTSSVRPMSKPVSLLSNLGHISTARSPQNGLSTMTGTPLSRASTLTSYPQTASSGVISNAPLGKNPYAILPSSSSSSATLSGTSRPFSSSTLSGTHRSPFETLSSAINVPPANTHREAGKSKPPSTSAGYHDLDLPPKRTLPFSNPDAKKSRPASKAADNAFANPPITETPSSLPKPRKEGGPRAAKGKRKPKPPQGTTPPPLGPPSSATPITTPKQAITTNTPTATFINESPIEPKPTTLLPTPADLAQYISNPTKERTATLENWICTHLEDDNFLQLCVDVEGIWQRFALGK
ncbi:hypothetical protein BDW62DRAFT_172102 [Aspergillus aurantiobrunneus]